MVNVFNENTLKRFCIASLWFLIGTLAGASANDALAAIDSGSQADVRTELGVIPRASNMFSKLVFTMEDGSVVEFHSHELVRISKKLLLDRRAEFVRPNMIPTYQSYQEQAEAEFRHFTRELLSKAAREYGVGESDLSTLIETFYTQGAAAVVGGPLLPELTRIMEVIRERKGVVDHILEETYDDHILPVQVVPSYSTLGWLGLASYIRDTLEPITGWWVNIGGRLILLRNLPHERRQHLYVSDHGSQRDVVQSTKDDLLTFTDKGRAEAMSSFMFDKFYSSLSKENKDLLKHRYLLLLTAHPSGTSARRDEFLLYTLSLPADYYQECLLRGRLDSPEFNMTTAVGGGSLQLLSVTDQAILASLSEETIVAYGKLFELALERIRYRAEQARTYVSGLYAGSNGGLSAFFTQIENTFPAADADRYRIFFILKEFAKKLGLGLQEFLFRPLHSFGSREKGESYRGFADAFTKYYGSTLARPAHELARETRELLKGRPLVDESVYFLPNLVAAWFVSESARNESSVLSTLMLLDLIESQTTLMDEEGNNRYQWRHTLVHPRKPADSHAVLLIKDLYGNDVDLANFDGMHPMAHAKSNPHSKQDLNNGQRLSPVRQKEGHLIIHWLSQRIKLMAEAECTPVEAKGDNLLTDPSYEEIDKLLKEKPSKPLLNKKWEVLQVIKRLLGQRFDTLDNLLSVER